MLINEQITAKEVRLLGENGEQLGVVSLQDALNSANHEDLDLVLISPMANPPVCKIMDYGKYKFDSIKKEKELKKNQKIVETKEIKLSMTIDTHDIETKAKHGNRFLLDGDKVKVTLRMKGRQQAYATTAIEVVNKFYELLSENGVVDKKPEVQGRNVIMIISPKKQ